MSEAEEQSTRPAPDAETPAPQVRQRHYRHGRAGNGLFLSLVLATVLVTLAMFAFGGHVLPMPDWARDRVENSINARLPGGRFEIGDIALSLGPDFAPRVQMENVAIADAAGGAVAVLNGVRTRLSPAALLRGRIAPERLELQGAQVTLRRAADGRFALAAPGAAGGEARPLGDLLAQLDGTLSAAPLRSIREIAAREVVITLEDARSGRIWQATNARLTVRRTETGLTLNVATDVFNGTDNVAEVQLSFGFDQRSRDTTLGVRLTGMPAPDIAAQSPALAWLGVLDAPISGAVRAAIDGDTGFAKLSGTLDIAGGALNPVEGSAPLGFDEARAYFDYDQARQRIDFTEIAVRSDNLDLTATGHTYLAEVREGWPGAFLGQFVVSRARVEAAEFFAAPLEPGRVRADLRLRLDPFTVELGQVTVEADPEDVRGRGRIEARSDGWHLAIDAETRQIAPATVMAYWPLTAAAKTRDWISENIRAGQLHDVFWSIRKEPGEKVDFGLTFDFRGTEARFMKDMPPITGASGWGAIQDRDFTLVMGAGGISVPGAGRIEAAGSVFKVPDLRQKPARAEIALRGGGPLGAVLGVLDRPPLRIMERAGRTPAIAAAQTVFEARLGLPLMRGLTYGDVDFAVDASLRDVASESIVAGRNLTAGAVTLRATPEGVSVAGPIALDGVPLSATWRQPLGPGAQGAGSSVSGSVELSPETLAALKVPLPAGLLAGRGTGRFAVTLAPDEAPRLALTSDLRGLRLALDGIGWTKPPDAAGSFALDTVLAAVPVVERLALTAPGLEAEGRLRLGADGTFEGADFARVKAGDWLEAPVRLTARGPGRAPAVAIEGGRFDLRAFPKTRSGGGDRAPVNLNLDLLIVSDGLRLAPVTGQIDAGSGGLSGSFEGRLGGQTPVRGTLAPANGGTALRIQSNDAGGAVRDAGLTPNAVGGTLDLVMTPVVGAPPGTYDGEFLIENIRLRKAPVMADLLDAISVVGLIDQLAGPGIRFDVVDGRFRLSPERLTLREMAAMGASLGISADGTYDLAAKQLDVSGVISPIYFVNAIGAVVSKRGEGLFGFTYRMTGPVSGPAVSVNPLSILTPGFFREIFRKSPPTE